MFSLGSRPSPGPYTQFISACGTRKKMGKRPGLKYHVSIVGGAIGKALLLFPEARSPSHLVEEPLAIDPYYMYHIRIVIDLIAEMIWRPLCEATPICESTMSLPSRDT